MKHLVVTVVNKKKERAKLWTRTRISRASTERPKKLVGMVVGPNGKLKINFILRDTGAQQVKTLTSSHTSLSILGFKELESTTHLCLI